MISQYGLLRTIRSWEEGAFDHGIQEFSNEVSKQTKNAVKLDIYRLMIEKVKAAKEEHAKKCNDGDTCTVTVNYIKFESYLKANLAVLHTNIFAQSLQEKAKAAMNRIVIEPNRTATLQSILHELDIPYTHGDIMDLKAYFKETGYATVVADTKDALDIKVVEKGMQYLAGQLQEKGIPVNIVDYKKDPDSPTKRSNMLNVIAGVVGGALLTLIINQLSGC